MLEAVDLDSTMPKGAYDAAQGALDPRLGELQRRIREAAIPVLIVFEGWDAAGKGTAISRLLWPLDPRGYKVYATNPPGEEERLRPPMWRFWRSLPPRGVLGIYDRSWYGQVLVERVEKLVPRRAWRDAYTRIRTFERQLTDDGAVILKFWLHIGKKEQASRFKALRKDPALAWKVTPDDLRRHRQYKDYVEAVEDMLRETSTANAPWVVVPSTDSRFALVTVAETVAHALEEALAHHAADSRPVPVTRRPAPRRTTVFDRIDLTQSLEREAYEAQLKDLQQELRRLEHLLYVHRRPAVIVFEGMDAAGKGGSIRRLTRELDPRGYEVVPIGPPEGDERTHHYLWRFWRAVPKAGHLTVYDRSWYGRVLVERLEGFATPPEWQRAYTEINEFEHDLTSAGAIMMKFWLHITKDEQLRRFRDREHTEGKQWKITPDDWRNRRRWDDYVVAASDLIERTSTREAPWTIVEANSKLFARTKVLRTAADTIRAALES